MPHRRSPFSVLTKRAEPSCWTARTTLTGVPADRPGSYRLGSRSALEWVLDQYKERKPRDPTIAEKFNAYRFAGHKERVIDLLQRVCAVSVGTMDVVDDMACLLENGKSAYTDTGMSPNGAPKTP